MSADGRYVAFTSAASNLVAGDTNGSYDVFVHDFAATEPLPPLDLTVESVSGNLVTLRWTTSIVRSGADGLCAIEGGTMPGQLLASYLTGSTRPTFVLAAPDGSFYVRVHALRGVARSAASNEVRVHVNVFIPPSAPANLLGLVNGSTVALTWVNTYAGGAPTSLSLDVSGTITHVVAPRLWRHGHDDERAARHSHAVASRNERGGIESGLERGDPHVSWPVLRATGRAVRRARVSAGSHRRRLVDAWRERARADGLRADRDGLGHRKRGHHLAPAERRRGAGRVHTQPGRGESLRRERSDLAGRADRALSASPAATGIPFMAPWANRLDEPAFYANGRRHAFDMTLGNIRGEVPIHGFVTTTNLWQVTSIAATDREASVTSRLDFYLEPAWMRQWPYAHEIDITYRLAAGVLEVETAIVNRGDEPMPVAVGFIPTFS